jgi:hypothetical protein
MVKHKEFLMTCYYICVKHFFLVVNATEVKKCLSQNKRRGCPNLKIISDKKPFTQEKSNGKYHRAKAKAKFVSVLRNRSQG